MKRLLTLLLCSVMTAACGEQRAASDAGCARSVEREVVFSNPDAPDKITAASEGPSCDQAAVRLSVRNADGDLLWTLSGDYHTLAHGGPQTPGAESTTPERMDSFLSAWADLESSRTSSLPAWAEGAAQPGASDGPLRFTTPLTRENYERLRAEDGTQICASVGVETSACLVIDPTTLRATEIVRFGP